MNRALALKKVEAIGQIFERQSHPNYWAHEDRHRAVRASALLPVLRQAYRATRDGSQKEAIEAIKQARQAVRTGIEYNQLSRALDALEEN